ncbi:hypothetical protein EDD11_010212 [Mortierella claussenii]|nr:hypothetical protein EDD11_010212 [Mortierella claussenii]
MTRAASNRKNGVGNAAASTRPGPVFKGRDVVFVDPLDDKESYWWPAMIVPVPEIDSSMDCTVLNPGECLVKYFEDNKYSVVPFTDLQPFVPTTIPFLEFELAAGQKFLKNGGVVNAMTYLDTGKVKRKFSWHRWGTAQDQELNLDMLKHNKPVSLPLISDEAFQDQQHHSQSQRGSVITSSGASSPATSTKNFTDSENDSPALSTGAAVASSSPLLTVTSSGGSLKNGLQKSLVGVGSQSSTTSLLPSPVSLNDMATEAMDETELSPRLTRAKTEGSNRKDSPTTPALTGTGRSRSRRGSRDVDSKASSTPASADKETSKRSRNISETSFSSSSNTNAGTTGAATSEPAVPHETAAKKRKTASAPVVSTDAHNGVSDATQSSTRSSRPGSAEPGSSPRSTRHSFRNLKASEASQQGQGGEDLTESPQETATPTRLQTHRMTRQRSTPKSASASLPPPSPVQSDKVNIDNGSVKEESLAGKIVSAKEEKDDESSAAFKERSDQSNKSASVATTTEGTSTAMNVDAYEDPSSQPKQQDREQSLSSIPPSSLVSSTAASSSSSPSSIGLEEGSSLSPISSNNGLILSLEQERREMDYSFEHVLPTLAIGSKEREAFYENCMEHLQKLRQEHRRLKDILKNSDYTPKGRRATRSSPQYHSNRHHHHHHRSHHHHHHHHHLEEKPNRRNSPNLSKANNSNSGNSSSAANNQSGNCNGHSMTSTTISSTTSKSSSAAAQVAAAAAAASASAAASSATTPSAPPVYQGSTPSSAILTSNISTTTRRSAATAAAAAVTATVSRGSRGSYNTSASESKKRNAAAQAAAAAVAAAAASASDGADSPTSTRAKRRQR